MSAQIFSILLILFAAFIGAIGPIFLKKGTKHLSIKALYKNVDLILGVCFYGVSMLLFIVAIRGGEISILYPLVSTSYIWVALLSQKYLKEEMNQNKWIGIILIIAGVSILAILG